jgi:hypothetical protein
MTLLQTRSQAIDDHFRFDSRHHAILAQVSLALGSLAAENMTATRRAVLDLASSRDLEPLFQAFVSLSFRHAARLSLCFSFELFLGGGL